MAHTAVPSEVTSVEALAPMVDQHVRAEVLSTDRARRHAILQGRLTAATDLRRHIVIRLTGRTAEDTQIIILHRPPDAPIVRPSDSTTTLLLGDLERVVLDTHKETVAPRGAMVEIRRT